MQVKYILFYTSEELECIRRRSKLDGVVMAFEDCGRYVFPTSVIVCLTVIGKPLRVAGLFKLLLMGWMLQDIIFIHIQSLIKCSLEGRATIHRVQVLKTKHQLYNINKNISHYNVIYLECQDHNNYTPLPPSTNIHLQDYRLNIQAGTHQQKHIIISRLSIIHSIA